ncbi:MAG: bifunctional hydroxymethylpyrimidine kinase/phosphomethylpyrimidine kinase [candidate division Zixibacteria bacterium]|nr:bifunctional hydroxymethylpyrimidine kinase/phosphomethylpyrimidine kinase [candidate division Zixibacteria bacterium]MCI0597210.1 bifunctional hydroxymethylpyrimidine kinase/phosphomethylpyrimidine kinase [candidate division Zixibacteria bacterium]
MKKFPVALTVAGSDSGGGAGIQADLKTFAAFKVFGTSVITAVTAQNTREVLDSCPLYPEEVESQLEAIFDDFKVRAVKTGMLANADIVSVVARKLKAERVRNLVVDPVLVAKSGARLLTADGAEVMVKKLFPLAALVTPNLPEAEAFAGMKITSEEDYRKAAEKLLGFGPRAVLIKGGHRSGDANDFYFDGKKGAWLLARRVKVKALHGSGCIFSAAISAHLAKGRPLFSSVKTAKGFMNRFLASPFKPGRGHWVADPVLQGR